MTEAPWWRRAVAIAFLPVILLAAAITGVFAKPVRRTPEDVVNYLSGFIANNGQPHDWDDFTAVSIADPELDSIRSRAADVELPLTTEGGNVLRELLAEARVLLRRS